MARLGLLCIALGVAFPIAGADQSQTPEAAKDQPHLRGSVAGNSSRPSAPEAGQQRSKEALAMVRADAHSSNITNSSNATSVRAEWFDWGRGHDGETCCMCSYQYGGPRGTVVIYAAEDYDNYWGGHDAFWHCENECERKCRFHTGGHKFGCLDERHLRSLSRVLRRAHGFEIEHQERFGNLC